MKTIHFGICTMLVPAIVFALLAAMAQEAPLATKPGNDVRLTVERDKQKEDQVAKLFESIRAEAKLPQLQRIRHRSSLEQGVCTSALTDKPSKLGSAFYITAAPESITPELAKIASSNLLYPNKKPRYARYSVAVWRVKDPPVLKVAYRVGVGLYGPAIDEFVDCHFTDDVHYCGRWKDSIARPCRGK
jgi:hypothetical protein